MENKSENNQILIDKNLTLAYSVALIRVDQARTWDEKTEHTSTRCKIPQIRELVNFNSLVPV